MAEQLEIPETVQSGDLIDVEYAIKPGANATLLGLAISRVKNDLWADKRFDYQGSVEIQKQDPETGETYQALIITVSVRKYPRGERPDVQKAGIIVPIVAIVAMMTAAYIGSYGLEYLTARVQARAVEAVANSNIAPADKGKAIGQIQTGSSVGLGSGVAAFGGSLATAAIIIGVLWALSLSQKGRGGE